MNDSVPRLGPLDWADWKTRFVLFTGKGGVGKTTVASARRGRSRRRRPARPAGQHRPGLQPRRRVPDRDRRRSAPAPGVPGLDVMDLDPQAAADAYRDRVLAPYRATLAAGRAGPLEEQLAGACTVEVAAFDAFTRLLADPDTTGRYDHVIFDTAPTGHTLRLLAAARRLVALPRRDPEDTTCLGPLAGLQGQRPLYEAAVAVLADPAATTLVLVARPDAAPSSRPLAPRSELRDLGLTNQRLVINGLLAHPLAGDPIAESYARRQEHVARPPPRDARRAACRRRAARRSSTWSASRRCAACARGERRRATSTPTAQSSGSDGFDDVDGLSTTRRRRPGRHLVTGKGGVGKTSIAVRIAAGLARRGLAVHLATTDPAGRLPAPGGVELPESVAVSRIDPHAEAARYAAEQPRGLDRRRSATWLSRICAPRAQPRSPCSGRSAGSSASAAPSTS